LGNWEEKVMRKTKLVSLVLAVMTVSALASVPAMASSQLKSSTFYRTDNTSYADRLSFELSGVGTIKKNTRVYDIYSSNKKVIDPWYVTYKVEKTTGAMKYVGTWPEEGPKYTVKLYFISEKNGSSLLKFTVDGRRYKKMIHVKKWTNPIKSLRFTKCTCSYHNYKNLFKNKNVASDYLQKDHTKNAKVRVKAAKNWEVKKLVLEKGNGDLIYTKELKNGKSAKEMVLPVLSLKTSKAYVVKADFVNVKNGGEESITLNLSAY
jgi:hypothetical protein